MQLLTFVLRKMLVVFKKHGDTKHKIQEVHETKGIHKEHKDRKVNIQSTNRQTRPQEYGGSDTDAGADCARC